MTSASGSRSSLSIRISCPGLNSAARLPATTAVFAFFTRSAYSSGPASVASSAADCSLAATTAQAIRITRSSS
ncbi:hypothetical protein RCIA143 [Methanocella arvoryzae MRE50]|uniref:Uncharacterized protein n=1 Tax=Methanocella arvoryzae (strain DSM 22066 / NBRC 105507 / MRE50) TaxID=351160 RepID=Q0W3K8_METAR|nr:hypothetical protein RCIA143 [Methanocella arvoryzae MRE50]